MLSNQRFALILTRSQLGTIALLGMLASAPRSPDALPKFLVAMFITIISLMLTRFQAESMSRRIQTGKKINRDESLRIFTDSAWVALPTCIPFFILVGRWLHLIPEGYALTSARYTAIGLLFVIGYVSSRLIGAKYWQSIFSGIIDMSLGLLIVTLNSWF